MLMFLFTYLHILCSFSRLFGTFLLDSLTWRRFRSCSLFVGFVWAFVLTLLMCRCWWSSPWASHLVKLTDVLRLFVRLDVVGIDVVGLLVVSRLPIVVGVLIELRLVIVTGSSPFVWIKTFVACCCSFCCLIIGLLICWLYGPLLLQLVAIARVVMLAFVGASLAGSAMGDWMARWLFYDFKEFGNRR